MKTSINIKGEEKEVYLTGYTKEVNGNLHHFVNLSAINNEPLYGEELTDSQTELYNHYKDSLIQSIENNAEDFWSGKVKANANLPDKKMLCV